MSNFQVPNKLAFPALMLAGGAVQAAVGYFATRKMTSSIEVHSTMLDSTQAIVFKIAALYTLIGAGAINYGAKYALEHSFSILVPKSWNVVAFVGQVLLVGGAIYCANQMESFEVTTYKKSADKWKELDQKLNARIEEALGQGSIVLLTAVVEEIAAAEEALNRVIAAECALPEGTTEAEIEVQDARLAFYTEKKAALQARLTEINYNRLARAWQELDGPLDTRIQEAGEDDQLLSDVVEEIAAAEEALNRVIAAGRALPEGTVTEEVAAEQDRRLNIYTEKKAELQGKLTTIHYNDLVNVWKDLDGRLDARIQQANKEDDQLLSDVVKEIEAAEEALNQVIAARGALPEGTVTEAEIEVQDARLAFYTKNREELSK